MKNTKRFLAVAMTAALTVGNSSVALAAGVTGNGIVEYDNSEAVAYDVVEVPTISADTYHFTLDPTGQLHEYAPATYDEGTVYFTATGDRAYIKAKTGKELYIESKKSVDAVSGAWDGIVTTVASGEITAVAGGYFVWVPKTLSEAEKAKWTGGAPGEFVALTKDNITKWFKLEDAENENNKKIVLRDDYKAEPDVCDGKVYQTQYEKDTDGIITDSDTDPLSKYVTIESGAATAFPNLYTDDQGTAATAEDIDYKSATSKKQGRTDAVTVINKSTNAKTVTATVTLKNVPNITFKDTNSYTDDTDASMYVAATNGTVTNALVAAADGETASATYTVDLAAPTVGEITYMTEQTNAATGGHNFARYEAYGTVYGSDSFYITATANGSADAKDAWDEWAEKVTAETRPEINIVYKVENKITGPSLRTTTATATNGSNTEIEYVGVRSDISDVKFGNTSVLSKTTITDGKIAVLSSWTDAWSSGMARELVISFTNGTSGTVTVTKQ